MKAIIWVIVLALVAWGIWFFVRDTDTIDTAGTGANVGGALDFNLDNNGNGNGATTDDDVDLTEFEDKG